MPHQWRSGIALKADRREGPCSIPCRACRPNHTKFSVGFLRNSRKYELRSLRKTPTEGTLPIGPSPRSGQLALHLQPT